MCNVVASPAGFKFQWGNDEYNVRINRQGRAVWKRWSDRRGFYKRVDLTACGDSKFRTLLDEAAKLAYRAELED